MRPSTPPSRRLRDGRRVEIRAQRPADRDAIAAAFRRSSPETIYRRFFGRRTGFTEKEVAFYLDLDFVNQVALVAELEEAGQKVIVGGGRYIVSPRRAGPRSPSPWTIRIKAWASPRA